jgi:hypothetical protein
MSLDRVMPYVVIAAGCFTASMTLGESSTFLRSLQLAGAVAIVGMGGFILGSKRTRDAYVGAWDSTIGKMPGNIVLEEGDDEVHAFVTTISGDVRMLTVPAEAAETPEDAIRWVCELLASEGDDE